jgi:CO/xanthine dehydrogenase FAD-binding subunit
VAPGLCLARWGRRLCAAVGAERALEGHRLEAGTIANASAAMEGLDPPSDEIASAWYRKQVAGVHLARLLTEMEQR